MLSSVLNSERAIQVNIAIMRTFTQLRQLLLSNTELARKLANLEKRYDAQFKVVFDAIRQLMTPFDPPRKHIGFHVRETGTIYGIRRKGKGDVLFRRLQEIPVGQPARQACRQP